MTRDEAKQRFDNFGKSFTLDQARLDVHILFDAIYDAHEANLTKACERITELEAIVKKMRNCHNCSAFQCLLNFERVNACKENKLYLWQLKTK